MEAIPADPRRCEDVTRILAPFGDGEAPHRAGDGIAVRLAGGEGELAAVVRALDAENVEIAHLQLHAPSLDDVFLAKTGRTLEGAGEGDEDGRGAGRLVSRATRIQIAALARRSFVRTLRQPAQVVPTVIFPLFLVAVNAGGLEAATELPGFPTNSYLSFAIAVPFIQAAIFAVNNGGADLARDIETGFFDRLALTPMSGGALIVAQLAGVVALGVLQSLIYLTIGVAFGASFDAGPAGVLVLIALALVIMFAFGCIGLYFAFRTGSSEAVQGLFPVLFVFLFLSSGSLPRNLIEQDWFRTIATYNPVSYLIEGVRSLFIIGWDPEALALAFGCAGGIAAVFMALATTSLRTRLTRT